MHRPQNKPERLVSNLENHLPATFTSDFEQQLRRGNQVIWSSSAAVDTPNLTAHCTSSLSNHVVRTGGLALLPELTTSDETNVHQVRGGVVLVSGGCHLSAWPHIAAPLGRADSLNL